MGYSGGGEAVVEVKRPRPVAETTERDGIDGAEDGGGTIVAAVDTFVFELQHAVEGSLEVVVHVADGAVAVVVEQHIGFLRIDVDEVAPVVPRAVVAYLAFEQADGTVETLYCLTQSTCLALAHGFHIEHKGFLAAVFEAARHADAKLCAAQTSVIGATFKILVCEHREHLQTARRL